MSNNEILEIYYPYIKKIAKNYEDVAQIVALDLLQKDNAKLNEMHNNNQLNFFILKMLYNQKNFKSTYYRDFKDFQKRSSEYNVNSYDKVDEIYIENKEYKLEDLQFYTSKTEYQLLSDWTKVNGKNKSQVYEKYNVNTVKFQRLLDRIRYRQRQYKQLKPVLKYFDTNTQSAITQMMKVSCCNIKPILDSHHISYNDWKKIRIEVQNYIPDFDFQACESR